MTGEKVKEVAAALTALLQKRSLELQRSMGIRSTVALWAERVHPEYVHDMHPNRRRPLLLLKHLLYMAEEIPKHVDAGKVDKAMRWLGFMQGVLWALGVAPLEELKRMNMPDEEKPRPPHTDAS